LVCGVKREETLSYLVRRFLMENPYQMVGKRVRFFREQDGLTQAELAEKNRVK